MTFATIPLPPFPNVPQVPGVPPLPRSISFPTPNVFNPHTPSVEAPTLRSDSRAITAAQATTKTPQWGIFDGSKPVVVADSVIGVDYRHEFRVADYPIEEGGFESYNKVATPYEARVSLAKGGTDADRTTFLNSLETVLASLTLYSVVTPEKSYAKANVVHYDYRREQKHGATLITADVWLAEVRVAAAPAFSAVQQPAAASTAQGGTVQPQTPTPGEAAGGAGAIAVAPPVGN